MLKHPGAGPPAATPSGGPAPLMLPSEQATANSARTQATGAVGYRLRNTFLSIFPTLVFGISLTTT